LGRAALMGGVALADGADDPAFLARGRRRLFPQLDATGVAVVKAVEDWVMFRRMRPTFCDPICVKPVQSAVEAFQVWHLRLSSADEAKTVQDAIDQGNDNVVASFKFRRVGILRYRDESAISEESATRVHAMWELAKPGAQVALARVWETAPATGQGWQNHFRVRNMLDQIADLTQPPARGDGAIAALPRAPGPLDDRALDGGMVVVTVEESHLIPHRVIMLSHAMYADLLPAFQQSADEGWGRLQALVKTKPDLLLDIPVNFANSQLPTADAKSIADADQQMQSPQTDFGYQLNAIRIDAAQLDADVDPVSQHKGVLALLNVSSTAAGGKVNDDGVFKVTQTDLGNGAEVVSLVSYFPINEQG
jgi:hypothetical protein